MRRRSLLVMLAILAAACTPASAADDSTVRILMGAPSTLDPAAAGDAASAAVIAQVFETLTTFDSDRELQPALAESWRLEANGRRIVFRLRSDLTFSDGTPLRAADVVRSWLRLIDPDRPSPLASLMMDVTGAAERLAGTGTAAEVGLLAVDDANEVIVDLDRPAGDFATVVAASPFAVVPPGFGADPTTELPGPDFVASGGYRIVAEDLQSLTLQANDRYWAGPPAIDTVTIVNDTGGRSGVQVFEDGDVDYAPIGDADAAWIAYDDELGPQLREVPSLSVDYYGFDTTEPPFDDVRVRQAFAAAVDWRRIARLAVVDPSAVATSMVPPGIPGRSDRDVVPAYDPEVGRARLAEAGYPGGEGFPAVTLLTGGSPYDEAVATEVERELGIELQLEVMGDGYFDRLDTDAPQMWFLSWVADYPGRNDFLGVLLSSTSTNNYGGWVSPEFDAAIAEALATSDEAEASAAYDRAEDIVGRDAPLIPVTYGTGWALARDGLLGAGQNGLGALRFAGLDWAD